MKTELPIICKNARNGKAFFHEPSQSQRSAVERGCAASESGAKAGL